MAQKLLAINVVDDLATNPEELFSSDSDTLDLYLLVSKTTELLDKYV